MSNRKSFTAPVWWIGIITFIILIPICFTVISFYNTRGNGGVDIEGEMRTVFISQAIILSILVAEGITFWKIRKKAFNRKFAWAYIICLLLAIIIVPVLNILFGVWADYFSDSMETVRTTRQILSMLSGGSLIAAHVFFVLVLISAFRKRPTLPVSETEGADLLEDYANT